MISCFLSLVHSVALSFSASVCQFNSIHLILSLFAFTPQALLANGALISCIYEDISSFFPCFYVVGCFWLCECVLSFLIFISICQEVAHKVAPLNSGLLIFLISERSLV